MAIDEGQPRISHFEEEVKCQYVDFEFAVERAVEMTAQKEIT